MKAIIRTKAGKEFKSMKVQEISSPIPESEELHIKMKASRVNPVDMDLMKGFPGLKYKKPQPGGIDGAGTVIGLGSNVSGFNVGDEVFFYHRFSDIGTWAEEITLRAADAAHIPENISLAEAGSIALPLLTAYESLKALQPKPAESILIHGAGGGVGFQAVQLARKLGLRVIANAGPNDEKALREAGVDQFINYKTEDYRQLLANHVPDYIFDVLGKQTLMDSIRLKPRKVVSLAYAATDQMHKTGVKLPGILKLLMGLMNRKLRNTAKKNGVQLISQVTGANGALLAEASQLISELDYMNREPRLLSLEEIEQCGLSPRDLGKTISFS